MKKRVLILSTSPRQAATPMPWRRLFAEGARSAGHTVSHCSLRDKSLHFCLGCLSCQETPGCVLRMIWQKFYRKCVPPMCWSLPPPSISTKCLDR